MSKVTGRIIVEVPIGADRQASRDLILNETLAFFTPDQIVEENGFLRGTIELTDVAEFFGRMLATAILEELSE